MNLKREKVEEIQQWSQDYVTEARKKSRTVSQMTTMWERINEWAKHIRNENLSTWGPPEAIQVVKYIETIGRDEYVTWASQQNKLNIFQKTMVNHGYTNWSRDSDHYKMATTTLNKIITDESKTEISKFRITKKQSGDLKRFEIEKMAAKLFMRAKSEKGGAYELLRCLQYITWVFANNCGMRIIDILRLQWDQIRVENGNLVQRIHFSKSDRRGRKRDELVIFNRYNYPADLRTAFKMCLDVKQRLPVKTNLMFPKPTNIKVAAESASMITGWQWAAGPLKLTEKVGARTPKVHFLNESYQSGTPPKLIHKTAAWGRNSTDIRRFYIKSHGGAVANDEE